MNDAEEQEALGLRGCGARSRPRRGGGGRGALTTAQDYSQVTALYGQACGDPYFVTFYGFTLIV